MNSLNPLLAQSDLPYQLPPFDRIELAHYRPAFEHGMVAQREEVEAIATAGEAPTFGNTVVALERSGEVLRRVSAIFFNQAAADTGPEIQAIETEVTPRLAAHHDAMYLNPELFSRIKAVHADREALEPESRRLVERYYLDFVRAGAALPQDKQTRLRELNEELSSLSSTFEHRLLADTAASAVVVDDVGHLDGLSDDAIAAAAEAAKERHLPDSYVLSLVLPTSQPALASLTNREVRERLHRASTKRGSNGNEHDTTDIVTRMTALRAERAALLGYRDHASYVLEDRMAGTPAAVHDMLGTLTPAAVANARAEAQRLQESIGDAYELRAWDWSIHSERVRRATYDIDASELRPYFELEQVLHHGVFFAATQLYGVTFTERQDLAGYHPGVRTFEVFDDDGAALGLFLLDAYARESKHGGAWMSSFVDQSRLLGTRPVVVNNLNIARPPDGEPTLMTFDEVTTMFHEFGHALHGLLSEVTYPSFSGTEVLQDFVEYPSQVNEMWALWPEVLANYARHHSTGEPLPQEVVDRLLASQTWGEGYKTTEYLAAALLDLAWHQIDTETTPEITDVAAFESAALERAGVALDAVPPRYRSAYFAHIFGGGYAAGYYSYIWSEVLDADSLEWFRENGGLTRANGDHFRATLLARGGAVDPMEAFRAFRGRDPKIEPLLTRRGLKPGVTAGSVR